MYLDSLVLYMMSNIIFVRLEVIHLHHLAAVYLVQHQLHLAVVLLVNHSLVMDLAHRVVTVKVHKDPIKA